MADGRPYAGALYDGIGWGNDLHDIFTAHLSDLDFDPELPRTARPPDGILWGRDSAAYLAILKGRW